MSDKIAPRADRKGFGMIRLMLAMHKNVAAILDERVTKRIELAEETIRIYRLGHLQAAETLYKRYMNKYHKEKHNEARN